MSAVVLLVCAAAFGQPLDAAENPPELPGVVVSQPLNILYQQPAGKKNPSPEQPPPQEQKPAETEGAPTTPAWYSLHGQATFIYQGQFPFHDPFDGPNSAVGRRLNDQTATGTLYFDAAPWHGAEIIFNPEFSGGIGIDNSFGFAGFPNGEATRAGKLEPTGYIARALFRQTFDLAGEGEKVEDGFNQIAGVRARNRFAVTVGKMSVEDLFDDNAYSHDPRTQFLNWSIMYTGAYDYPANVRGYTDGVVFDYTTMFYAVRYGIFAEPTRANDPELDPHFFKAHGQILELEQDFILGDHPAHLREFGYLNTAHMGKYQDALAEMPVNPDITLTRSYRNKYGFVASFDKEITDDLGFFLRAGWNDGQTESWAFTEIDETAALGLLLKGRAWGRPQDQVGLAGVMNGLSNQHKEYLAAGGIGFIIGDGRLNYGPETIGETYYNWEWRKGINVTLDFQGIKNPAYNQDRGPVVVGGLRVHVEY
jgi:high affinity Mn2+ porin